MRSGFAVMVCIALALAFPAAWAQNPYSPALTVNQSVITYYDIDQRVLFLDALGATGDLEALALEQLTEDRVKLQAAEALGLEMSDEALEAGLDEFAAARGITAEDVLRVLEARGIDRQTLDDFIRSGVLWREVITTRFRARSMPTEEDLDIALGLQADTPVEVIQLAEIAIPFEERGQAETVAFAEGLADELQRGASFPAAVRRYSRSASAEQGGVLPPVPAGELPPAIRGQVLLMDPGGVTDPIPISGGLAILRVVSIGEEPPRALDEVPEAERREALREQLFSQRIEAFGQGYLQELMRDALIVEQ